MVLPNFTPSPTSSNLVVTIDPSQLPLSIAGSFTASNAQGAPNTVANAWPIRITDLTNSVAVKPASVAALATDPALVVAISPNNSLTVANPSVGLTGAAIPLSATLMGMSDGTLTRAPMGFDLDTGVGTEWNIGVSIRLPASGGSVVGGTSGNPIRTDPTGTTTQPVSISGSVTVAQATASNLNANIGTWIGSSAPTVGSKTSANSLPVVVASDQGAISVTATNSYLLDATFTGRINTLGQKTMASSTPVTLASDQSALTSTQGNAGTNAQAWWTQIGDTTHGPVAVKAASTAAAAADSSLVVGFSPNSPLPAGSNAVGTVTATQATAASLNATVVQGAGSGAAGTYWYSRITDGTNTLPTLDTAGRSGFMRWTDGTNTAAVKAASTAAVAADPSAVVALSPNSPLPAGASTIGAVTQASGPWTQNLTLVGGAAVALGQAAMASSLPVAIASNQGAITTQLPSALVGGRLDENIGSWMGSTAPTIGSKTAANSLPVVLNSDMGSDNSGNATSKLPALVARANASAPAWTEGNQVPLSTDLSGNLRILSDVVATGAIAAQGATVQITLSGRSGVGVRIASGTFIGTLIPEVSIDGTANSWQQTFFDDPTNTLGRFSALSFTTNNTETTLSLIGVGGAAFARIRASAYISGSANITLNAAEMSDPSALWSGPVGTAAPPSITQIGGPDSTGLLRPISVDRETQVVKVLNYDDGRANTNATLTAVLTELRTIRQETALRLGDATLLFQ